MVNHIPAKFGDNQHLGIGDIMFFLSRDLARPCDYIIM